MIRIKKKNDVWLEVTGDRGDLRMMSEYFTFEIEGAKFTPAFKNKIWDGKIRLLDLRNGSIYVGLMGEIAKFAKDLDVEVIVEGDKYNLPGMEQPLEDDFAEGFLKALNPHSKGNPIEMRDYQKEAFKWCIKNERGLILSPTASGKSLIIYSLIRWYREVHERKILIIVPTVSLVSQMIGDFTDYSNGQFQDVHGITGGSSKSPIFIDIVLHNNKKITLLEDDWVYLTDNTRKRAGLLTESDEINDEWLAKNYQ